MKRDYSQEGNNLSIEDSSVQERTVGNLTHTQTHTRPALSFYFYFFILIQSHGSVHTGRPDCRSTSGTEDLGSLSCGVWRRMAWASMGRRPLGCGMSA